MDEMGSCPHFVSMLPNCDELDAGSSHDEHKQLASSRHLLVG